MLARWWRMKCKPGFAMKSEAAFGVRYQSILNAAIDAFGGTVIPIPLAPDGSSKCFMLAHDDNDYSVVTMALELEECFITITRDYTHSADDAQGELECNMVKFATAVGQIMNVLECHLDDTWCTMGREQDAENLPAYGETPHLIDKAFGPGSK